MPTDQAGRRTEPWPDAVSIDNGPFSDGTPRFNTLTQHLVFWAAHGRRVELELQSGALVVTPYNDMGESGYRYFFILGAGESTEAVLDQVL